MTPFLLSLPGPSFPFAFAAGGTKRQCWLLSKQQGQRRKTIRFRDCYLVQSIEIGRYPDLEPCLARDLPFAFTLRFHAECDRSIGNRPMQSVIEVTAVVRLPRLTTESSFGIVGRFQEEEDKIDDFSRRKTLAEVSSRLILRIEPSCGKTCGSDGLIHATIEPSTSDKLGP